MFLICQVILKMRAHTEMTRVALSLLSESSHITSLCFGISYVRSSNFNRSPIWVCHVAGGNEEVNECGSTILATLRYLVTWPGIV